MGAKPYPIVNEQWGSDGTMEVQIWGQTAETYVALLGKIKTFVITHLKQRKQHYV